MNPIWLYGPADSGSAGAGSQPDWYTGFLDGALRLVPPGWEVVWLDRTWTLAILVPLAVVTVFLLLVAVYPFVEEWITGDHRDHHLLERPRNAPTRTAIGVAAVVFYGALWVAGSADLIATAFQLTIEQVIAVLQATARVRPADRLLHRAPRVPGAAEEGPGGAAARLRDRTHRAPPRRRVRRGAPTGERVRALAHRRGRRPSPAPAAPRRARADHRGAAAASAAVAVLLRGPHRGRVADRAGRGPARAVAGRADAARRRRCARSGCRGIRPCERSGCRGIRRRAQLRS